MLKRLQEARKNEKGFTLIELLIVIVILGVLAGIVVFAVSGINNKSQDSACKSDIKNVEIAQEAAYAKSAQGGTAAYDASVAALVTDGFLKEAPSTSYYTIATGLTGVVTVGGAAYTGTQCDAV